MTGCLRVRHCEKTGRTQEHAVIKFEAPKGSIALYPVNCFLTIPRAICKSDGQHCGAQWLRYLCPLWII